MATIVLTDADVTFDSVDLSDHVKKVTITTSMELHDNTAMGATGRGRQGGLRDESVTLEFRQDFDAASVDATVWSAYTGGVAVPIIILPTSAVVGAGNPSWTGNVLVENYTPIDGEVGTLLDAPLTLQVDGVLTRAVA